MYQNKKDDCEPKVVKVEHQINGKEVIIAGLLGAGIALSAVGAIYLITNNAQNVRPSVTMEVKPERIINKIIDLAVNRFIGV